MIGMMIKIKNQADAALRTKKDAIALRREIVAIANLSHAAIEDYRAKRRKS